MPDYEINNSSVFQPLVCNAKWIRLEDKHSHVTCITDNTQLYYKIKHGKLDNDIASQPTNKRYHHKLIPNIKFK